MPLILTYCRIYRRTFTPTLAVVVDNKAPPRLGCVVRTLDDEISKLWEELHLAA